MKYRKKPIIIEAIQWNGKNIEEIKSFMNYARGSGKVLNRKMRINTLEGAVWANEEDYIIKGIKGEFYPCKPDIFKDTYESVDEDTECTRQK